MWDRGSDVDLSVYGHRGRRFVVAYGRRGTTTHGGSVSFFRVAVLCRQWAACIRGRDAVGSLGVGAFVTWDRHILSVFSTVSSCDLFGVCVCVVDQGLRHLLATRDRPSVCLTACMD